MLPLFKHYLSIGQRLRTGMCCNVVLLLRGVADKYFLSSNFFRMIPRNFRVLLSLIGISGPLLSRVMSQNSAETKIVSYLEMKETANAGNGYIIDVRRREEIEETGSIPSSINVPCKYPTEPEVLVQIEGDIARMITIIFIYYAVDEVQDAFNMSPSDYASKYHREKPDPNTKIIFSCRLGGRSAEALKIVTAMGYNK